ncbi:MAG: lysine--tRNA ligase [Acidobacteriota bacterium]
MEDHTRIRLEKIEKIEELGLETYPYEFDVVDKLTDIKAKYSDDDREKLENTKISVKTAGRIVAIRKMGKSAFLHIFDGEEKLQLYIRKDIVSEEEFALFKLLDIADIIGISGTLFKTKSEELTILISELRFLTKSLHPLPEKWHGLQDKELRFRQRYLDLIVNENSRNIVKVRSAIIQNIRMFFYDKEYVEVETPMMHPIPGGASARPFVTHHNALSTDFYLRIAPELYLKRLLVGGMSKVFEVNRNFRNEGIDLMHNPEFTMLEFYELYKDFNYYMDLTEEMFSTLNEKILKGDSIEFQENTISLKPPFRKAGYMELISEKSGIPLEDLWDEKKLLGFIRGKFNEDDIPPTFGKMLDLMFDHYVEKHLIQPTFVTNYPKAISPLSKESRGDKRETERFELFIAGMEIANGFSELNDPVEQRRRFESQVQDREKGDDEAQVVDNDFLKALEHGMPPAAGEGIGIDRLVMLYTGAENIKEVILFPTLRPKE